MQNELPVAIVFMLLARGLEVLLPAGRGCSKGMHRLDKEYRQVRAEDALDPSRGSTAVMRGMLRSRCGICRARCKKPLA